MGRTARACFGASVLAFTAVIATVGLTGCNQTNTGDDLIVVKELKLPTGKRVDCAVLYEVAQKSGENNEPSGIDCNWAEQK